MTKQEVDHYLRRLVQKHNTGWLLNEIGGVGVANWTNVHLGSDPSQNSNIIHNLEAHSIDELVARLYVSTDGTEANGFEVIGLSMFGAAADYGYTIYYVDSNTVKLQTCDGGLNYADDNGAIQAITNQDWYYNIVIYAFHGKVI